MIKVVIAKQPNALEKIFQDLNLNEVLKEKKKIFIKVNLRAAAVKDYTPCAITSLSIIKLLTDNLLALDKEITIAEGTSSEVMTEKAIENSGLKKLSSEQVKIVNLNTTKTKRIYLPNSKLKYIDVYQIVLDTDYLISLPVMKTHTATYVSLAMKNMMGITGEMILPRFHLKNIDHSIAELNQAVKPDLCLIDATKAMEGTGPVLGSEVKLNKIIAGFDPVAVDSVAAQMMGLNPKIIGHLIYGQKIKLGRIKPEQIIGKLRVKKFRKPSHGFVLDLYSYKWFDWLMSKKIIHKLCYDYAYFIIKKMLSLVRHKDKNTSHLDENR